MPSVLEMNTWEAIRMVVRAAAVRWILRSKVITAPQHRNAKLTMTCEPSVEYRFKPSQLPSDERWEFLKDVNGTYHTGNSMVVLKPSEHDIL